MLYLAIDDRGTIWPSGPVTWMSSNCSLLRRSARTDQWYHFVTAAIHIEAVDEIAARGNGKVDADLRTA